MLQKSSMTLTLPWGETFVIALDVYSAYAHDLLIEFLFEDKWYFLEFGQHSIKLCKLTANSFAHSDRSRPGVQPALQGKQDMMSLLRKSIGYLVQSKITATLQNTE